MPTRVRLVSLALVLALPLAACGSSHGAPVTADSQLRFGVDMAKRGLWSEAFFRFQQAQRLEGTNPRVLSNLAVASEALGKFDQALAFYKQALALAPGDPDLKANYDRFVSFYESFRARSEDKGKAVPATPPSDAGTPGPARPSRPEPPMQPEPPPPPPGSEPGDVPPLMPPEPQPTPPLSTSLPGGAAHA